MGGLWELIWAGGPWLVAAQAAFTLWMFIDAHRNHAEQMWYWIILFFQPVGTWLYFIVVKLPSFRLPRGVNNSQLWQRKLSLDELRYRVERTPTVINHVAYAERLMENGEHDDAIPHLESALALDETYCQALHDLAVCHIACRQAMQALATLERLMKRDARWADYRAWRTQIDAHDALGRRDDALQTCRELEKRQPTWENKCQLAERLIDNGHKDEALRILDQALEDHQYAPLKIRLRHWRWARHAKQLIKEAERGS